MKRRDVLTMCAGAAGAAALALGFGAAAPAAAQQKMVMKAADVHPLGYPTVEAVVRMGEKLERATDGRLSIQMYPSMQLGGEKEMIEQAQVGALQIARISVGPMGPIVDELNVFNMPFVFRDEAHMRKVIDGPIGAEMLDKLSAQNRYALAFRLHNMKSEAGRKKKIADFVDMLKRGETIYPQKAGHPGRAGQGADRSAGRGRLTPGRRA